MYTFGTITGLVVSYLPVVAIPVWVTVYIVLKIRENKRELRARIKILRDKLADIERGGGRWGC